MLLSCAYHVICTFLYHYLSTTIIPLYTFYRAFPCCAYLPTNHCTIPIRRDGLICYIRINKSLIYMCDIKIIDDGNNTQNKIKIKAIIRRKTITTISRRKTNTLTNISTNIHIYLKNHKLIIQVLINTVEHG